MEQDPKWHRMSKPVKASELSLNDKVLASRFCVEQGAKEDGKPKLRAVDDETASGVNPCCEASTKLVYDKLDWHDTLSSARRLLAGPEKQTSTAHTGAFL